jgi:hypothetical protein
MRRAALCASVAAVTLLIRRTIMVLNEVRHEQALQRAARARVHHAMIHPNCRSNHWII